jgi:hypothetical protein
VVNVGPEGACCMQLRRSSSLFLMHLTVMRYRSRGAVMAVESYACHMLLLTRALRSRLNQSNQLLSIRSAVGLPVG